MTCEVAVMNRLGVALAADSAVTFTQVHVDRQERTFATGANKIFQLTEYEPVGAMVFNNANLQGVPWEVIVKAFRAEFGAQHFGTLAEYVNALQDFILNHPVLFPATHRESEFQTLCAKSAFQLLEIAQNHHPILWDPDRSANHPQEWAALAEAMTRLLREQPLNPAFTEEKISQAVAKYADWLGEEISKYLSSMPGTKHLDGVIPPRDAATIAIEGIFRTPRQVFGPQYTGVVVSGFGRDEFFPSFIECRCYGFVLDALLFERESHHVITHENTSAIEAFATKSMVETFLQGVSPSAWSHAHKLVRQVLEQSCSQLLNEIGAPPATADVSSRVIDEACNTFQDEWARSVLAAHYHPLRGVISGLTMEELAELAETLVLLESLKEKVTSRTQSVGGPVDVAVITKSEGLVWIKRKLFFSPELNHRYFDRQRRSIEPRYENQAN